MKMYMYPNIFFFIKKKYVYFYITKKTEISTILFLYIIYTYNLMSNRKVVSFAYINYVYNYEHW